jgi:hypothetical protein
MVSFFFCLLFFFIFGLFFSHRFEPGPPRWEASD